MGNWWQSASASMFPRSACWFSLRIHCCPFQCEVMKGRKQGCVSPNTLNMIYHSGRWCLGVVRSLPFSFLFVLLVSLGWFTWLSLVVTSAKNWSSEADCHPPTATLSIALGRDSQKGLEQQRCVCMYVSVYLRVRYSWDTCFSHSDRLVVQVTLLQCPTQEICPTARPSTRPLFTPLSPRALSLSCSVINVHKSIVLLLCNPSRGNNASLKERRPLGGRLWELISRLGWERTMAHAEMSKGECNEVYFTTVTMFTYKSFSNCGLYSGSPFKVALGISIQC